MTQQYGIDLKSKSDAQIAEAVIVSELAKLLGRRPKKPEFDGEQRFFYEPPSYISFRSEELSRALGVMTTTEISLGSAGQPVAPSFKELIVRIGSSVYKLGLGGIHSSETCVCHRADEDTILCDIDVASYYPAVILNQRLYPAHLGEAFLDVYRSIRDRRLKAKEDGDEVTSSSLKITINGSFGKFGDMFSALYAPKLMIQVTITGQLSLLMLIERLESVGIPVVSGNTDGIIIKCQKARYDELKAIIKEWEQVTGFETEETRYAMTGNRDVNNYWAQKPDGSFKTKGVYSEKGSALNSVLSKNPENLILMDAVKAFIGKGVPLEKTIRECKDFRRFVAVRNVKGGAVWKGQYLGKVVRWYYAAGERSIIQYLEGGNKVPKSEGARPAMDLPDELPADIDYPRYVAMADEILFETGFYPPKQGAFFS
jgi:hypothetical protein